MKHYRPKNYTLEELAHPQIIRTIGPENTWRRLNPAALWDLDLLRDLWYEATGSGIYVNRLEIGIDSRGLRPPNDPDGSFYSIHKQGGSFDVEPVKGTVQGLWQFARSLMEGGDFRALNTIESLKFTPGWVHLAAMNHEKLCWIIEP